MNVKKTIFINEVKKQLRELPRFYGEVMVLRYYEGLTVDEIAETLESTSERVKEALDRLDSIRCTAEQLANL